MSKTIGTLEVTGAVIVSTEKGNVEKEGVLRPVCAFTVQDEDMGMTVKVLLFNEYARELWASRLGGFRSMPGEETIALGNDLIHKSWHTTVSFYGAIREVRKDVIVVENPDVLEFKEEVSYVTLAGDPNEDVQLG